LRQGLTGPAFPLTRLDQPLRLVQSDRALPFQATRFDRWADMPYNCFSGNGTIVPWLGGGGERAVGVPRGNE